MEKFKEIQKHYDILRDLWLEYWKEDVVFTFQWWTLLFFLIFPFFLWWKFVDKSRLKEISFVGLASSMIAYILDQIGASLKLWTYPYTLTPLEREVWDPADFAIIPFFYMMIYQKWNGWRPYLMALTVFGFFAAYVGGNIFQWLGIYKMDNWRHIYSVPIYILIGIALKALMVKFNSVENSSKRN